MRPAYFRTLFPVSRYLPPAVSLKVKEPDAPGSSLTHPTSSTGLRASDVGGWRRLSQRQARWNEAGREDDGGCSEHCLLLERVAQTLYLQQCDDGERRALHAAVRSSGARPGSSSRSATAGSAPSTSRRCGFSSPARCSRSSSHSSARDGRAAAPSGRSSSGSASCCSRADYGLIYWGEQFLDSGLTAILFATLPVDHGRLRARLHPGRPRSPRASSPARCSPSLASSRCSATACGSTGRSSDRCWPSSAAPSAPRRPVSRRKRHGALDARRGAQRASDARRRGRRWPSPRWQPAKASGCRGTG